MFFSSFHRSNGFANMKQRKKAENWRARGGETPGKCPHEMKRMFATCREMWLSFGRQARAPTARFRWQFISCR
jgi:hypothetical protein